MSEGFSGQSIDPVAGSTAHTRQIDLTTVPVADGSTIGLGGAGMDVSQLVEDIYLTTTDQRDAASVHVTVLERPDNGMAEPSTGMTQQSIGREAQGPEQSAATAADNSASMKAIEDAAIALTYKTLMINVAWGMALRMSKDISTLAKGG